MTDGVAGSYDVFFYSDGSVTVVPDGAKTPPADGYQRRVTVPAAKDHGDALRQAYGHVDAYPVLRDAGADLAHLTHARWGERQPFKVGADAQTWAWGQDLPMFDGHRLITALHMPGECDAHEVTGRVQIVGAVSSEALVSPLEASE